MAGRRESGFQRGLYIPAEIRFFVNKVRAAPYNKVSPFLKRKSTAELLDQYKLLREDWLATNVGSPWLSTPYQRVRIASC